MDWCDLSELREASGQYAQLIQHNTFGVDVHAHEDVERLHNAIQNVVLSEIGDVLAHYNVNQTRVISLIETTRVIITKLIKLIGDNMHTLVDVDPDVGNVFRFLTEIDGVLVNEHLNLILRLHTDPTAADEDALKRLTLYNGGCYGQMDFEEFYSKYLAAKVSICGDEYDPEEDDLKILYAQERRLNYLIAQNVDEQIGIILQNKLISIQKEIKTELEFRHTPPCPASQSFDDGVSMEPSPELSTPNFSLLDTIDPTVNFDIAALYSLLIREGVIKDIDVHLFSECITHAHINLLWDISGNLRERNRLQCLLKMLGSEYYPKQWINKCANNLGVPIKAITNPTRSGATDAINDKLRKILKAKK